MEELVNKVLQGDCLELLQLLPNGSVDMILTDLPYGTTGIAWDIPIDLDRLWLQYERVIQTSWSDRTQCAGNIYW